MSSHPIDLTFNSIWIILCNKQRCAKDNQALIRRGLTYLTPASLWTRQIVNNYGLNTVGSLPADIMMRISDSQVATDL